MMETLQGTPMDAAKIRRWTDHDLVLSCERTLLFQGWSNGTDEELSPYNWRKEELSVEDGCIMWGIRIVVPPAVREKVLNKLHDGHPGIM